MMRNLKSVKWRLPNDENKNESTTMTFKKIFRINTSTSTSSSSSSSSSSSNSLNNKHNINRWFRGLSSSENKDQLTHSHTIFEKISKLKIIETYTPKTDSDIDPISITTTESSTTMIHLNNNINKLKNSNQLINNSESIIEDESTIVVPENYTEYYEFSFDENSLDKFKIKLINQYSTESYNKSFFLKMKKKKSFHDLLTISNNKK